MEQILQEQAYNIDAAVAILFSCGAANSKSNSGLNLNSGTPDLYLT